MSEENVEIVRRLIAAFNGGGDAELADELVEPGARFEPLLAGVEGAIYRGPEGIMKWVAEVNEIFAELQADYSDIEDFGDVMMRGNRS